MNSVAHSLYLHSAGELATHTVGTGTAANVLLLHGWGDSSRVWNDAFLDPGMQKFRLTSVDLLGFGNSSKPKGFSYSLEDQAAVVGDLVREQYPDGAHIVGHSMGGATGLLAARGLGNYAKSFVSIEGNMVPEDTSAFTRLLAKQSPASFRFLAYPAITSVLCLSPRASQRGWGRGWMQASASALHQSTRSLAEWSSDDAFMEMYKELRLPKAYMYGSSSARREQQVAKPLANGGARTYMIEGAGHMSMREKPDAFYAALANVLRAVATFPRQP